MEQLKKKRTQLKRSMTRLYKFISGQNNDYNDVKVRIDEFEIIYKQYKDTQNEIEMLYEDENEINKEEAYCGEIEEMYFTAKSIFSSFAQEIIENTIVENPSTSPQCSNELTELLQTMSSTLASVVNIQASSSDTSSNNNNSSIRLPPIEIPDFDGNLSNWIRFKDLFNAMVDSNTNLSNVEKLEYLQSKLKGEASSLIKHLTPTNSNYRIAWDLVNRKYDKPDKIREAYINLLVNQPSIKNGTLPEVRQFYNNTAECFNALNVLYESVSSWDPLLLFLMKEKLDKDTLTLWYRQQNDNEEQSFQRLLDFLESRVVELESLNTPLTAKSSRMSRLVHVTTATHSCPICKNDHFLFMCQQFKDLDIEKRRGIVRKAGLCFNCLKETHFSKECKASSCRTCGLRHNTLLHSGNSLSLFKGKQPDNGNQSSITINSSQTTSRTTTILPTAVIRVRDKSNSLQPCRALIDTSAQSTLITEACVQRLQLNRSYDKTVLHGLGGNNTSHTRGKVQLEILSEDSKRTIIVQTLCLSSLTQYIPSQKIISRNLEYFKELKLADPSYFKPNQIDIILGADVFPHCILGEKLSHPSGFPTALHTIFGWVIMGNVNRQLEDSIIVAHSHTGLDEQLQRFWETEECIVQTKYLTPEEERAVQHFNENVQRQVDGRYMVKLPFKADSFQLGESKIAAMRRLESMERQFARNCDLKVGFHKFMDEYLQLNHMEIAPTATKHQVYFMPHHAVLKPSSVTTKLRVVFDASCKSSNNTSLNDHLLVGATVQKELYTILLKFRKYRIGFTADIEKMYRQVLIHPDDRSYQSILWRKSPHDVPTTYQLKTVTYGTAAAPFLATRTLMQVAIDNSQEFPDEANEIMNNFYVDDYMSSAPDLETACSRCTKLCLILANSGFNLRKWSTNSRELLENIKPENRAQSSEMIIDYSGTVKTLGLLWNTSFDSFQYSSCFQQVSGIVTKRHVLSGISKIYDPIGWLSPVVVKMKIFMQKVWVKGVTWDEDLPDNLKAEWLHIRHDIGSIQDLKIPRWCNYDIGDRIELHGFADSSELAFAAAIYLRVIRSDGSMVTSLITAKTKVAPIRQITLPRLELCAAHLMTKLMLKVKNSLEWQNVPSFGWTDSTVVLAWLSDHPRRWKTFIANRTSYIIAMIPSQNWRHITSKKNPADLATRGISVYEVKHNKLWWQGPESLLTDQVEYRTTKLTTLADGIDLEERKVIATTTLVRQTGLLNLFSTYNTLLRVTSLILRFVNNCKNEHRRQTGFITTIELQEAHKTLIRKAQHDSYAVEIHVLKSTNKIPAGSKLASLCPFLDDFGSLRVGGRLDKASISYDQKHPYILHKGNPLTLLLVRHYHFKHLHAGTRQLQYLLGLKYWIPGISQVIKRIVYQCTTCMRFRQKSYQQRMRDLPSCRLQPCSTFLFIGIDFAGPILVRSWKGRGYKSYKCWLAIFVCLNTKAIHLEAVTDLTSQSFFASLRRFTSRRGTPLHIYTDNGTNFVGCNREMKELFDFLHTNQSSIQREMANDEIKWHFIPPSAPNFGGIWEAGVKSVKFHLERVLGNSSITYEELTTLLCQIECCLNSRPLCLKFEGDIDPLTPAHFLILRAMKSMPDENLIDANVNRLSRWQYIQSLVQHFWSKWSNEYLCQLQQRPKWRQSMQNLKIDDIVLVDSNLPPTQWLIGKVLATHPGKDDLVRVVSIQTTKGLLKRPISKVCPLFMDN